MYISGQVVLIMLLVGLVAGWLAGQLVKGAGFGLIADVAIGIVGAFIGTWLLPQLGVRIGSSQRDHCRDYRRRDPVADRRIIYKRISTTPILALATLRSDRGLVYRRARHCRGDQLVSRQVVAGSSRFSAPSCCYTLPPRIRPTVSPSACDLRFLLLYLEPSAAPVGGACF